MLNAVRKSGLKLNKSKCFFNVQEVTFLGHKISAEGLSPDPSKVKAISEMPIPNNKAELHTFLGMVAYLAKFFDHLSDNTKVLRTLIEKKQCLGF